MNDDKKRNSPLVLSTDSIKEKSYTIRGTQVMFDTGLAELYNVETRALNQAVKRNTERFPKTFMFQLNEKEYKNWIPQFVI